MTSQTETPVTLPEQLRLYAHLFVAAMVLTWVASSLPYPYRFASIVTAAVAVGFAALALWATVGMARPALMRAVLIAGGLLAMLSATSGLVSLVLAPELIEQSQCEREALTRIALEQCENDFWDSVEARLPITRPA